ncbi:MAG TPA: polysaccharide deacetylase family protein [Xanthobacteraceae bacterium]|nr:polysaccharide deacetylase family protein [Xanthobacteraceae bacterium]
MLVRALLAVLAVGFAVPAAAAGTDCPGNPNALGTSRVLVVDPAAHPRIGTMQYHESLPLQDHEVVLTFDDGPLPPYSKRVLETLASQCVKATYFMVGRMASAYPDVVKQIYAAGHTIGTHSQNHPLRFEHMSLPQVQKEVDDGIASVGAALGDPDKVAPFFRIPGLLRANTVENFLAERKIMVWSADFPADDWTHISSSEVLRRALTRLEQHHKGVLLLHDIQPRTALMLPQLLRELKRRGYHIVQVVPASPTQPATPTTPDQWVPNGAPVGHQNLPDSDMAERAATTTPALAAPSPPNFGVAPLGSQFAPSAPTPDLRGDVTGSVGAGPATTANLPKSGVP